MVDAGCQDSRNQGMSDKTNSQSKPAAKTGPLNYQDIQPFPKSKHATTTYFFKENGSRQERRNHQPRNLLSDNLYMTNPLPQKKRSYTFNRTQNMVSRFRQNQSFQNVINKGSHLEFPSAT